MATVTRVRGGCILHWTEIQPFARGLRPMGRGHVAELSHDRRKGSRPCASVRLVGYDAVRRELFPQQHSRPVISTCSRLTQVVAKTKKKIWCDFVAKNYA